jgi:hypothetical protein
MRWDVSRYAGPRKGKKEIDVDDDHHDDLVLVDVSARIGC